MQVLLCLQVMSHIIEGVGINDFQRLQMQQNITTFEDILGGCERLLRTPIPVSYTRHTSRFLLIWLTILPLALYAKLAWATVPAVGFISLLLLGAGFAAAAPCCGVAPARMEAQAARQLTCILHQAAQVAACSPLTGAALPAVLTHCRSRCAQPANKNARRRSHTARC